MKKTDNFTISSNTRIIASNKNRYLVTNEATNINDIYNYGVIVDKDGMILNGPELIGVIIKSGYWIPENLHFKDLKDRIEIRKSISDAIIGFVVGSTIKNGKNSIEPNIYCDGIYDKNAYLLLKCLKLFSSKKEFDYKEILKDFNNLNDKNGEITYYSLSLFFALLITYNVIDYNNLFDNYFSYFKSEKDKLGCLILIVFWVKILETKDKLESFNYVKKIDYSQLFNTKNVNLFDKIFDLNSTDFYDQQDVFKTIKIMFNIILSTEDYENAMMQIVKYNVNFSILFSIIGAIYGILHGEENIPIDWIIELRDETNIRNTIDEFSDSIQKIGESKNAGFINKKG